MINFIKKQIEKHPTLWEVFKFLLIGGIATLIDFFVMGVVLYAWDSSLYGHSFIKVFFSGYEPNVWATVVATGMGFSVSFIFNYLLSVFFVFSNKSNSTERAKSKSGFILFLLFALIGLAMHTVGMYIGYDLLKINEWIVKIILTAIVMAFNYITRKKIIFKKTDDEIDGGCKNDSLGDTN